MHLPLRHILSLLGLALLLASCSVDRYVQPTDKLLKSSHFSVEMPNDESLAKPVAEALSGMRNYEVQNPNKNILGVRLKMYLYLMAAPDRDGWLSNYFRRKGEAPVVFDPNAAIRTSKQLQTLLESKGCFTSTVRFDTLHLKHHDMSVTYHIQPSLRYRLEDITYRTENEEVLAYLHSWRDESLLRKGDYYDQANIAAERDRLTEKLRNEGYFYATKDIISFLIDTAYNDGTLSIEVNVGNPRITNQDNSVSSIPLNKYCINHIYFYPNGSNTLPSHDTLLFDYTLGNRTTTYSFLNSGELSLSPKVIARSMFLFHGQLFRDQNISRTYNSLLNLHNFKYINVDFTPTGGADSDTNWLDAHIKFIPSTRQKLSLSLEVNNSSPYGSLQTGLNSGNFGLETILSYQNKNLFGGAELLSIEGSFLIEMPKLFLSDRENSSVSAFEYGFNTSLDLPTLLLPFYHDFFWQRLKPHTVIGAGINYQNRQYFERLLANLSFGYSWNQNRTAKHQVNPIELTFARFFDIDPKFWNRIESIAQNNGRLKYQYSSHFIFDARYDYVYTNQQFGTRQNFTYLHLSVESAGSLLNGLSHLFHGPVDSSGVRMVYGVPFAQYGRIQGEWKHNFYHGSKGSFVTRALLGIGLPYGNSNQMQMPYEKSFFGGGPTTMRAWHLRRLGPGLFQHQDNALLERTGDMTLVLNLEERYPLFGIFEGALFADIGNVWLIYDNNEFEGGQFTFRNFLPSLAVGTGFGIRALISILTLRFDVGLPVYDPGYASGQRFRIPLWGQYKWDFRHSQFGPFTFNFGIDYPF